VGAWAAEILTDMGGKVLAVSDVASAVVNENGLDIKGLREHLKSGKIRCNDPEMIR
jgi:glutamate dehydrogenase (NAD(P)+)